MTSAEDSITRWFAEQSRLDSHRFPIGIGDDMAQIQLSADASVLITTDMLLDGTHFDLSRCTLAQAARKAMAVSLSDCAAMATRPIAAVVSTALPPGWGPEQLKELHAGIRAAGDPFDCQLIGGDITVWPRDTGIPPVQDDRGTGILPVHKKSVAEGDPCNAIRNTQPAIPNTNENRVPSSRFAISVTMLSIPGPRPPVRRSTARPHDIICVTGSLGGAYTRGTGIPFASLRTGLPVRHSDSNAAPRVAGVSPASAEGILPSDHPDHSHHLEFTPRVHEALAITEIVPLNAMMDLSDGLSSDLTRICEQSGVGAIIESAKLPISGAASKSPDPVASALNDGEDFELLFTLTADNYKQLIAAWTYPTPITPIGRITSDRKLLLQSPEGTTTPITPSGYDHLA